MFHEMALTQYFLKCSERKISQCILAFIFQEVTFRVQKVERTHSEKTSSISGNLTF